MKRSNCDKICVLHLEDDNSDAELIRATLEMGKCNCEFTYAKNGIEFETALRSKKFDIILGDFRLPGYSGTTGLKRALEICPEVPFIFVSGTMGEDAAIEGLTEGATDYVLKQKLSRLVPAINRALSEAENLREKKRIETELVDSMSRFRAVADSANEGIISTDIHGSIIYWNKAARKIFGYAEEEVIGKNFSLLLPMDKRDEYLEVFGIQNRQRSQQRPGRTVEGFGRKKNGDVIPIEISISNWKTHEGLFYTAMVRDISVRKEAVANLKLQSAALEAVANGIVITDKTGFITWVNPAFLKLTGYSADQILRHNPRIFKSGKQDTEFYKNLWKTILSGKVWHGEVVNQKADNSLYTEEMTISPVRETNGEINHFVAVKQDVSDRKKHEREREAIILVANAMRNAITREDLLQNFFQQISDLFNADGCMLVEKDPLSDDVLVKFGYGRIGEKFIGLRVPHDKGISSRVIREGKPYQNNKATNDPQFFRSDLLGDSVAVGCVPLVAQNSIIGALWVVRKSPFYKSDIKLLFAISNLAANAIHRVVLFDQTKYQLQLMASLHQIDVTISSIFNLKKVFNIIIKNTIELLGVDAASILLINPKSGYLEFASGVGFQSENITKTKLKLGEDQAGIAAAEKRNIAVPDLRIPEDNFYQSILRNQEGFISQYVFPLIVKGEVKGVLEGFCRKRIETRPEWFDFFEALATQAAIAVENASLFNDLQHSNEELTIAYDATIEGWSRALDLRDKETEGHTLRVTKMAEDLARDIGMDETLITNIRRGALLHDIGKMGVPDAILLKPEKLTDEEWVIMKQHPTFAFEMLSQIKYLHDSIDIPYCHHEKWDGSGYPRGLKKKRIPLNARIFSIVDVWDALTSDRPYRAAWSQEKALQYINDEAGKHFDPELIPIFLRLARKY